MGDRITLGGVRGEVVRLGFLKTTIMEMGQPPSVADTTLRRRHRSGGRVNSRQYTGRLVTVTNGVIFTGPVYNCTREFPYLWEEIVLPVAYTDDRDRAEQILLAAARDHGIVNDPDAESALAVMQSRFALFDASLEPAVYWRITDNWFELSLRFLEPHRGVRDIKDRMNRDILTALDAAGIGIASATYDIVGLTPIVVVRRRSRIRPRAAHDRAPSVCRR